MSTENIIKEILKKNIKELLKEEFNYERSLDAFKNEIENILSEYEWFGGLKVYLDEVGFTDMGGKVTDETKILNVIIYSNNDEPKTYPFDYLWDELSFYAETYFPDEKNYFLTIYDFRLVTSSNNTYAIL